MRRVTYFSLLVAAAVLCCWLLYGAYTVARQEAIEALQTQQTILAKQAAQGIQDFFTHMRSLADSMARNHHVVDMDREAQAYLKTMLHQNSLELKGITRVDPSGHIVYSIPDGSVVGRDISNQAHVARALNLRRAAASDVITTVQGFRAVALHVPVHEKGEFKGTLALLIDFDAIAKRYLEGIRVADSGYAVVYSKDGYLLYTPVRGLVDKHYMDVTRDHPGLRALVERMLKGESGTGTYTFNRVRDMDGNEVVKQAAFVPVPFEDTFWSVCVSTPESEILTAIKRFGTFLLPLGSLMLLLTGFTVALVLRHFMREREMTLRRRTEAVLRESEERYRSVIENISDVFYRTDQNGRLVMLSPSGVALMGYATEQEVLGRPLDEFWSRPGERAKLLAAIEEQGGVRDYEVEMRTKTGDTIYVATSSNYYRDKAGKVLGVEGIYRDVTARKRDHAAMMESEQRFHALFDHMAEGVSLNTLVTDPKGRVIDYRVVAVNKSFGKIFNVRPEQVVGKLATESFELQAAPYLQEVTEAVVTGMPFSTETPLTRLSKRVAVSVTRWMDGGFAAIFTDVTQRKEMEEELLHRALHDPLTGLANRSLCLDRINQAMERARRRSGMGFAVVFMDLDRFKLANDSLGHEAGDMLLREIAARLVACTRRLDTVGRYGGDEFVLVLEELSPREVLRTLSRIRESLKTPVTIGTHRLQVEASFGVAFPPAATAEHGADGLGAEDILRNANIALHRAKQHGRNRVVVYRQSMHEAAIQVMSLESDIRSGIGKNEFHLVYQPIFDLNTDRLCGFEALLRWQHPVRGPVSPVEFIPVAEESGAIFQLGGLALERGCRDMADYLKTLPEGACVTLSVNLSPRQFSRPGLAEQIDQALHISGLPAEALVLEITESSILKHPEASAAILARLKGKGVGIAIDDFGTGYSSMSALQRLPLDRLKIDRSFVMRITESAEDREIVRAIITLARSLRLKTVAEGIETEEQRQLLKSLGCDMGQGYLCSRPIKLEDAHATINTKVCGIPGT